MQRIRSRSSLRSAPARTSSDFSRMTYRRGRMLHLDHLTIVAPALVDGVNHVRTCLGIDIPYGRVHPDMGTHNHVLRLGDGAYLEVIAVNPGAPLPVGPRWFGLDDKNAVQTAWDRGFRLRGWVARTDDIDSVLSQHGKILGRKTQLSREGRVFSFSLLPDGSLPLGGVAPSVIDRDGRAPPIGSMPDLGAQLRALVVEHPDPDEVAALYEKLGIENPPTVQKGDQLRYRAKIETPSGLKELY
jgi:Glyoxalase-like domain